MLLFVYLLGGFKPVTIIICIIIIIIIRCQRACRDRPRPRFQAIAADLRRKNPRTTRDPRSRDSGTPLRPGQTRLEKKITLESNRRTQNCMILTS